MMKSVNPEILRSVHGISLEAALLIDRLNKYQFYNRHDGDFKEFLSVDLADLNYYVNVLLQQLELTKSDLEDLTKLKLAHFYPESEIEITEEKKKELMQKFSHIFDKYKHERPY